MVTIFPNNRGMEMFVPPGLRDLSRQPVEHLCGGQTRQGMAPLWGKLRHRAQNKVSQMHAGMGQSQPRCVDDKVAVSYEVNVNQAVGIAP